MIIIIIYDLLCFDVKVNSLLQIVTIFAPSTFASARKKAFHLKRH